MAHWAIAEGVKSIYGGWSWLYVLIFSVLIGSMLVLLISK